METDNNTDTETSTSDNSDIASRIELTDIDQEQLEETIYDLLYDAITENPLLYSKPDFHEVLQEDLSQYIINDFTEMGIIMNIHDYYKFVQTIRNKINSFFIHNSRGIHERSHYETNVPSSMTKTFIDKQIAHIRTLPQPEQKTAAWYKYRHELITASSIYKVFASQSQINSLIYEKCKPFIEKETTSTNNWHSTNSLQWGVLFEPVSVHVYEHLNNTNVSDFGCIQHEKYHYIGASPDGINTNPNSNLYGRMLEVKNIVNRDITGIPKEEYWIQMQGQMEVCNLEECDFLETRFKEYEEVEQFYTDTNKQRGIILCFIENNVPNSPPTYVYSRMDMTMDKDTVDKWIRAETDSKCGKYSLFNKRFWYLDEYSCVLVKRNKLWFRKAVPKIKDVWDTIIKERENGFEHRATKKRSLGQCVFVSSDNDNVTTTRTIHNIQSNNSLEVVKL